jgi:hypothetical protein
LARTDECKDPSDDNMSAAAINVTANGPANEASTSVATDDVAETLATSDGART